MVKGLEMSLAYIRKAKSLSVVDRLEMYGFVGQITVNWPEVFCICVLNGM